MALQPIKKGSWVEVADILVLNANDTKTVLTTELRDYTFTFDDDKECLVLGIGELFNHSDDANVSYELIDLNGRKRMVFIAKRDINKAEQLFIDYSADLREGETKQSYTVNMYE
jgi:hypothetical protein